MSKIVLIIISAVFINNYCLSQFMGICPFLGVSKKIDSAFGMGCAVTFVMTFATAITYPIYLYILTPFNLGYLSTVIFILIIALFVQLVEMILKRYIPALYQSLGVYLPLITTNCAVLGVTLTNIETYTHFYEALVNAIGAGLGFLLALMLFSGVRKRIENNDVAKTFAGVPITLVAAAIVSLAFMGFAGIIE